jgi:hypothetical protein
MLVQVVLVYACRHCAGQSDRDSQDLSLLPQPATVIHLRAACELVAATNTTGAVDALHSLLGYLTGTNSIHTFTIENLFSLIHKDRSTEETAGES